MDRTISTFRVLQTPVTVAPNVFASCTPNVPTPPAAPLTRTFCPDCTLPLSRNACNAVSAAIGMAAACSAVTFSGRKANLAVGAQAYSAYAPLQHPKTSSPTLNCVTFLPTASTWPATSAPSRVSVGPRKPPAGIRIGYGSPRMKCQSYGFTDAARTLMRTSSSLGTSFSTSTNCTTSGGPYFVYLAAFIAPLATENGRSFRSVRCAQAHKYTMR